MLRDAHIVFNSSELRKFVVSNQIFHMNDVFITGNDPTGYYCPLFMVFALSRNTHVVQIMLEAGLYINLKTPHGNNYLH